MNWKYLLKNKLNYIVLAITILIILYPISFLIYAVKWDALACCLPWRFMVGESISHGYLPWWNPYQSLGYPLHADMQITPWYLPVWIVSLITPYTLLIVQYEYIFHVILAGIGMFWFLKTLKVDTIGCFIISISYSLSGVMIGNAQHSHHIITAAWLPFVIGSFYHLLKNPTFQHILTFSLFSWLIVTGGYLGLLVVIVYALVLWFFINQYFYFKQHRSLNFKLIKACMIAFLLIFLLCLPQFVSIIQSLPFMSRQNGIPLESALFGAFTPHSFISFILPYTTVKNPNWLGTDISMANIYIGICTLCLALMGMWYPNKTKWFFLIIIILSLMTSLGKDTPLRTFFYNYIPLMNFSRFPAIFRIFSIFSLLMLGVLGWKLLMTNFAKYIKHFRYILIFMFLLILSFFIYYILNIPFSIKKFFLFAAFKDNATVGLKHHLLFQSILQLILLASILTVSVFCKKQKNWTRIIILIVITDFAISVNLNAPYTIYDQKISYAKVNDTRKNYELGFKQIHDYKICETDSICRIKIHHPLYENTATLIKHVTPNAFTSFLLKDFADTQDNRTNYLDSISKNKVCFLTQDIRDIKQFDSDFNHKNFNSNTVYTDNLNKIIPSAFFQGSVDKIKMSPSEISMEVNTNSNSLLVLLQSYYPYWKVYVDGKEYPIIKVSKAFMGAYIAKENKCVTFKYENNKVFYSNIISLIALFLILIGLLYSSINKKFRDKSV